LEVNVHDFGSIMGMKLSDDGSVLATFSSLGLVNIWDTETWESICCLRDEKVFPFPFLFFLLLLFKIQILIIIQKKKKKKKGNPNRRILLWNFFK